MKTPKIPRTLKVNGNTWKIKKKKDVFDDDGNKVKGLTCPDEKLILLENETIADEHKTNSKRVIAHEILHLILSEYYFTFDHTLEEVLVDTISTELDKIFSIEFRSK